MLARGHLYPLTKLAAPVIAERATAVSLSTVAGSIAAPHISCTYMRMVWCSVCWLVSTQVWACATCGCYAPVPPLSPTAPAAVFLCGKRLWAQQQCQEVPVRTGLHSMQRLMASALLHARVAV